MKITHPMIGVWEDTDLSEALVTAVKALPELPTSVQKSRIEWDKDNSVAPSGTYTDPSGVGVAEAVATVMAAAPAKRRRLAVAMNFRTTHDLDVVRKALGVVPKRTAKVVEAVEEIAPPKGSRPAKRAVKVAA